MNEAAGVVRLDAKLGMSPWQPMTLVGEIDAGVAPMERFHRVIETTTSAPCDLRAGVWEAEAYCERVDDYPYNEIVFGVAGSVSIIDENGNDELFRPGESFFLQKGFRGYWKQHETLRIFHMTVAPRE